MSFTEKAGGKVRAGALSALLATGAGGVACSSEKPLPPLQDNNMAAMDNSAAKTTDFIPGYRFYDWVKEKEGKEGATLTAQMMEAVHNRDEKKALSLIGQGADTQIVMGRDGSYNSLAGEAAAYGLPNLLTILASTGQGGLDVRFDDPGNILHYVAENFGVMGDETAFDLKHNRSTIPQRDREAVWKFLIEGHPALLGHLNQEGMTPLEAAIKDQNVDFVRFITRNPEYLKASLNVWPCPRIEEVSGIKRELPPERDPEHLEKYARSFADLKPGTEGYHGAFGAGNIMVDYEFEHDWTKKEAYFAVRHNQAGTIAEIVEKACRRLGMPEQYQATAGERGR